MLQQLMCELCVKNGNIYAFLIALLFSRIFSQLNLNFESQLHLNTSLFAFHCRKCNKLFYNLIDNFFVTARFLPSGLCSACFLAY